MDKDFEKEYKRLGETEATKWQMMEYSWAIKALAEGLTERSVWRQFSKIEDTLRYLNEFRGHFTKNPELNGKEADFASNLHTYMRKVMDSPLSVILYRMIAENRGTPVWWSFVKGLVSSKNNFKEAINKANLQYNTDKTTDNLIMYQALRIWEDQNFSDAIKWLKGT